VRWLHPAGSYLGSIRMRAYFGLGDIGAADSIEIRRPEGAVKVFPGGAVDRQSESRKSEGARQ
jgi:ASPIC/UnbV protein